MCEKELKREDEEMKGYMERYGKCEALIGDK